MVMGGGAGGALKSVANCLSQLYLSAARRSFSFLFSCKGNFMVSDQIRP